MTKWRQLIALRVDDEKFDLGPYIDAAESAGWERSSENGVYYLAEAIADAHTEQGCMFEIVPDDPWEQSDD